MEILVCWKSLNKKILFTILAVCVFIFILDKTKGFSLSQVVSLVFEFLVLVPLWYGNLKLTCSLKNEDDCWWQPSAKKIEPVSSERLEQVKKEGEHLRQPSFLSSGYYKLLIEGWLKYFISNATIEMLKQNKKETEHASWCWKLLIKIFAQAEEEANKSNISSPNYWFIYSFLVDQEDTRKGRVIILEGGGRRSIIEKVGDRKKGVVKEKRFLLK